MIKPTDPRMRDVNVQEALSTEVRMLGRLLKENYKPNHPVFTNAVKGFMSRLENVMQNLEENVHTSSVIGLGIREQVKLELEHLGPLINLLEASFISQEIRDELVKYCDAVLEIIMEAKGNIVRAA